MPRHDLPGNAPLASQRSGRLEVVGRDAPETVFAIPNLDSPTFTEGDF